MQNDHTNPFEITIIDAVEVAEIVYRAMLDTKVKIANVDWAEACKYIALTSTE